MGTKVKGLLKGLRYISHMFDEEKDKDIQIGFPTDVKHVGHIGWDGPSADTPSWMNDFKSAPLNSPIDSREDPEIQWVSEDSRRRNRSAPNSPDHDNPEQTKSSSRREKNSTDSPKKKDSSTKSRHSRRHHSKDSGEGSGKSTRQLQDLSLGTDSPPQDLPDIPKKSRRKKSKESVGDGSSRRSKHRDSDGSSRSKTKMGSSSGTYTSPNSDPGAEIMGSVLRTQPSVIPSVDDQEKGLSIITKDC